MSFSNKRTPTKTMDMLDPGSPIPEDSSGSAPTTPRSPRSYGSAPTTPRATRISANFGSNPDISSGAAPDRVSLDSEQRAVSPSAEAPRQSVGERVKRMEQQQQATDMTTRVVQEVKPKEDKEKTIPKQQQQQQQQQQQHEEHLVKEREVSQESQEKGVGTPKTKVKVIEIAGQVEKQVINERPKPETALSSSGTSAAAGSGRASKGGKITVQTTSKPKYFPFFFFFFFFFFCKLSGDSPHHCHF